MKNATLRFCNLFFVAVAVSGCSRNKEYVVHIENPSPANPPCVCESKPISSLQAGDVIVWVNGESLTRDDFDRGIRGIQWEFQHTTKKMKPKEIEAQYLMLGRTYMDRFVNDQLLIQESRRRKSFTAQQMMRQIELGVEHMCTAYKISRQKLFETFPGGSMEVMRNIEDFVWKRAVATNIPPVLVVTDDVVSNIIQQLTAENREIMARNLAKQQLLRDWKQLILTNHLSFAAFAEKNSKCPFMLPGEGGHWGEFRKVDFSEESSQLIFSLKPDDISDVLEDDDGYYIAKLERYESEQQTEVGKIVDKVAVLSRIFLPKEPISYIGEYSDFKRDLSQQFHQQAIDAALDDLKKKSIVVYPHGTNFWEKTK